jgi:hypothetical protein
MVYWTEFKTTILPWVIAGALIWLVVSDGRRRDGEMMAQQLRLTQSIEQIHLLLSTQGFISPPTTPLTDLASPFGALESR